MDYTVGGKYRLEEEIANGGCGSYNQQPFCIPVLTLGSNLGTVFLGVHTVAGKEVAIKLEPAVTKNSPLKQESKIYKTLMGGTGVPWIMWSGKKGDYNVLVIDLLGPSLEDLFKTCDRRFSLKTVLLLADQLVRHNLFGVQQVICKLTEIFPRSTRFPVSNSSTRILLYIGTSNLRTSLWVLERLLTWSMSLTLAWPKNTAILEP